jgi:RimJ/RimL family protein N-acetyltransferase
MVHARGVLGLGRIVAIATRANRASGRVLTRLGFRLEGGVTLPGDPEALDLYASNA